MDPLHNQVREALAADSVANMLVTSLPQTSAQDALCCEVGPEPFRRLAAFYLFGRVQTGFAEATIRDDLAWMETHFQAWVNRQTQAQDDAPVLREELHARQPLPEHGRQPEDRLRAVRTVQATPGHWLHQPWAKDLYGRWSEKLPAAVAQARQWLAENPGTQEEHAPADTGDTARREGR